MAFQISPGVNVSEIDLTTVVPSVLSTAGAFAGRFTWGPANKIKLIDNEINLATTFGEPVSNTAIPFFTAANFLSYGNNLQIVRAVNIGAKNAEANSVTPNIQVTNEDVYEATYLNVNSANTYGPIMARYPGALGNSIKVEVFDSANTTLFNTWTYKGYFTSTPGTSSYVSSAGGANDEIHVVVVDSGGLFTGTAGTVLETYPFVSKAADASINGSTNYYKQVIFNNSKYVYAMDPVDFTNTSATWGLGSTTSFARISSATYPSGNAAIILSGGTDATVTDANLQTAWDLFKNKESTDISLVITGDASVVVQQYVIDNIVNSRMDCVAFVSPPSSNVVNQAGNETSNIQAWLAALARSSS